MDPAVTLLLELFHEVPHVMVCVKGSDGRYVAANAAFARRARHQNVRGVIGRRAGELFQAELAASYDAQDQAVLVTGRAIVNLLEPIEDSGGERRWYLTTKTRHDTTDGPLVAVVSVETPLGGDAASGLKAAVELAHSSIAEGVDVGRLAAAAAMSTDRLERAMRRTLGMSPKQYVLRLRAEHAARLLASTDRPIVQIAAECGYYDQAALARQFRRHIGMSPSEYRQTAST